MSKFTIVAIIAAFLGNASWATAGERHGPCTASPPQQWLSLTDLAGRVEARGYAVREIEINHGCGEAHVLDANGVRAELRLDPVDGRIVGRR